MFMVYECERGCGPADTQSQSLEVSLQGFITIASFQDHRPHSKCQQCFPDQPRTSRISARTSRRKRATSTSIHRSRPSSPRHWKDIVSPCIWYSFFPPLSSELLGETNAIKYNKSVIRSNNFFVGCGCICIITQPYGIHFICKNLAHCFLQNYIFCFSSHNIRTWSFSLFPKCFSEAFF